MGWEKIKGRRYFYETTFENGERVRVCHGSGIEAQIAAARVAQERQLRAVDIARVRALKAEYQQVEQLIDHHATRIHHTINKKLHLAGYHYLRGKWRKKHTKMNAQSHLIELKNDTLLLDQVHEITPPESEQLSQEINRLALEALRGISPGPSSERQDAPRVTIRCKIDDTIAEVAAKVKSLRDELQYEHANPFDRLVIDQLTNAWVQWYVAGWLLDGELVPNRTWRENQYYALRYKQCQTRLTKAIDQLARIRQISSQALDIITPEEKAANQLRNQQQEEERKAKFQAMMDELEAEIKAEEEENDED